MPALDLGYVALTDAAPLLAAQTLGLFAEEGLSVSLHKEASWATLRDKVGAGLFQGAHMLAPMAIAASMGVGSPRAALIAPMTLNANGAAIGVSRALAADLFAPLHDGPGALAELAQTIARRRDKGAPSLRFAVVFPYSLHSYMLRFWLASAGIDSDRDVRLLVAPPVEIAARLAAGEIDGFCVGAPWGDVSAAYSGARILTDSHAFWPGAPDKVLGLSAPWAERAPDAAKALIRAVLRAAAWADAPENRIALADIVAEHTGADRGIVALRLSAQEPSSLRFLSGDAAFPKRAHAAWIVSQMLRWGHVKSGDDIEIGLSAYRPDLYRAAAEPLGLAAEINAAPDWPASEAGAPASLQPQALADYAARFEMSRVNL